MIVTNAVELIKEYKRQIKFASFFGEWLFKNVTEHEGSYYIGDSDNLMSMEEVLEIFMYKYYKNENDR